MGVSSVLDLTDELDRANQETDPAARVQRLRDLRTNLAFLVGTADRYIGDAELAREGQTIKTVHNQLDARADADARQRLVDQAIVAPEAADRAGLFSHAQLDRQPILAEMRELPDRPRELVDLWEAPVDTPVPVTEADEWLNQPSTLDVYARRLDDGTLVIDQSRQQLHQQIVDGILSGARRQSQPVAHLIGGPTDHTRLVEFLAGRTAKCPAGTVLIDEHHVRQLIPEYSEMLHSGDSQANLVVRDESRLIAGLVLTEAIKRGVHVAVTGLGVAGITERAGALREAGYRVEAFYTSGTPQLALTEAEDVRADPSVPFEAKVLLPDQDLIMGFYRVADALPEIAETVDELHVFNVDGETFQPVFRQVDGQPVVINPDGWEQATHPTNPFGQED